MKRIPKQEYTAAFKKQAVAMVKGGKTVAQAARALGLVEQTLRNWVKLAAQGKLHEGAKDITPEQMELSRLRAENARLKLENEIPQRKAAVAKYNSSPKGRKTRARARAKYSATGARLPADRPNDNALTVLAIAARL